MKISPIVLLAFLVSCTKTIDAPSEKTRLLADKKAEACDFGMQVFNKTKRAPTQETHILQERYTLKKKPRGEPVISSNATILLDFDGHVVSNTLWNAGVGEINATPANLREVEIDKILKRVSEDFSPFDVTVTTDEALYNRTNPLKRVRVIITENWEWFGVVGGTAYVNSFVWGDDTPCFVFSTLLNYNEKFIAEAISHEAGHTLGLLHQALYDGCNFLSEYNLGFGEGVTSWAPIMGIGYYHNVTTWHKGPTVLGCDAIQDDVAIISNTLGLKPDDNTGMNPAKQIDTEAGGMINNPNDIDYYFLHIKNPTLITAEPQCLENGEGANLNLKLKLYDKHGAFIKTIDTPSSLSVSTTLSKDKYYVGVETEANGNQGRYGMLGRYTLRLTE